MKKERLQQLLRACIILIKTNTNNVKSTFEHLGFTPNELKELGFGDVEKDAMLQLAEDIVIELKESKFDDVDDSSGYFLIREFEDKTERGVDVYKSTRGEIPHYIIKIMYEDDTSDFKFTKDLSTKALKNMLEEIYNEEC